MTEPETKERRLDASSDAAPNLTKMFQDTMNEWVEKFQQMEEELAKEKAARQKLDSENDGLKNDLRPSRFDTQRVCEDKTKAERESEKHKERVTQLEAKNGKLTEKFKELEQTTNDHASKKTLEIKNLPHLYTLTSAPHNTTRYDGPFPPSTSTTMAEPSSKRRRIEEPAEESSRESTTIHYHCNEVMAKIKEMEDKLAVEAIMEADLRAENTILDSRFTDALIDAQRACEDKMKLDLEFNTAQKEIQKQKEEVTQLKKENEKLKNEKAGLKLEKGDQEYKLEVSKAKEVEQASQIQELKSKNENQGDTIRKVLEEKAKQKVMVAT